MALSAPLMSPFKPRRDVDKPHCRKSARAMVRFGADIPGVLVAIEAIALA
jgi:hypothetical protein